MSSLKKVNASAVYAVQHMPMKTYPLLIVKRFDDLDATEKEYAETALNTTDLPTKAIYAFLSVTAGNKEYTHLATADSPDSAVRRCFAESLTATVDKSKFFSVLTDFCHQFNTALYLAV